MASLRDTGWAYFDAIVAAAPSRDVNPWVAGSSSGGVATYEPDYDTLELLLGVPVLLAASSQSGVPALALDVWVSYEFRRAGFDPDRVWPRATAPRVLPPDIKDFVEKLPKKDQARLWPRIARGVGGMGSANLLGKNYVKQVDVVMSSWATGPELMVSTKRMDSSFGKNAANRAEESYGDAKNLRLRHPQAALGFFYALSAIALQTEADTAEWLIDLLIKLGREDDAYDAVSLVLPDLARSQEPGDPEPSDAAGPIEAGAVPDDEPPEDPQDAPTLDFATDPSPEPTPDAAPDTRPAGDNAAEVADVARVTPVRLHREGVPAELDPGRFFEVMIRRVLDNSPVNFHAAARARRRQPRLP